MAPIPKPAGGPSTSSYPEAWKTIEFSSTKGPFKWAKLDGLFRPNEMKEVDVELTQIHDPDEIYVIKSGADKSIGLLNVQMGRYISKLIVEVYPDYVTKLADFYETGICVAAKNRENSWARGLVLRIHEGEKLKLDIFFVDHGDIKEEMDLNDVFPMPHKFVEQLEFQAIALKLDHIASVKSYWTKKTVKLMDRILFHRNGEAKKLDVMVSCKIGQTPESCHLYGAFIYAGTKYELGEVLVGCKLACYKDGKTTEEWFQKKKTAMLAHLSKKVDKMLKTSEEEEEEEVENQADILDMIVTLDRYAAGAAGFHEGEGFELFG